MLRVILDHPFYPENVGAAARAVSNFGLAGLEVVNGPPLDDPAAVRMATSGRRVLQEAKVWNSLDESLADADYVVMTTHKAYEDVVDLTPREAAPLIRSREGKVALVFGNEKNGFSRLDLERADLVVRIPSRGSLNLAQAVLLVAYELSQVPATRYAYLADSEAFHGLIETAMPILFEGPLLHRHRRIGALKRVLGRLAMTPREAYLLRGAFRRLGEALRNRG